MSFLRDPKRLIATLIAGVAGLLVLIDFAGSVGSVDALARVLVNWAALLAALALLVGLLSVAISHFMRVLRRRPDWGYSVVLLVAMLLVIISGTVVGFWNTGGETKVVLFPQLVEQPIRDLFRAFYQPLAASFLALLAFFGLSAALRALRRRTADALVIVIIAVVVLALAGLPQLAALPLLGDGVRWVSDYVALAGARGLLLGSALGALVVGVRVLLGFDQPFLDR
ncbi:MAG TPA: hypothetical protein VGJ87_00545 [Roseiflexaceae bacterium]|jgi:hypothetical protein